MSPRRWQERVQDILEAIAEIRVFTQGMDFETFRSDPKSIRAVEMNFVIIGEAANKISEDVQAAHPEVHWRRMNAMRNVLVHDYSSSDPKILWETIRDDLPSLVEPLEKLLEETV